MYPADGSRPVPRPDQHPRITDETFASSRGPEYHCERFPLRHGCLDYSDATLADRNNEANIKLFHHNGQIRENITVSVDTLNNRVCGVTNAFSPIALAEALPVYAITATVYGSGTITPAGVTNFPAGGSQTYTFTAAPGYKVLGITVGVVESFFGTLKRELVQLL